MVTVADRALTVEELRAAAVAVRRGDFRRCGSSSGPGWSLSGCAGAVLVLAAHPGAGASCFATALADALAAADASPVRLVDTADPGRSGLVAATDTELGVQGQWRLGRRGSVAVIRPAHPVRSVDDVPAPVVAVGERVVVDAGWPGADVVAGSGWVSVACATAAVVVVFRATVPGARHAERVAASLVSPTWVAVGPRRWHPAVQASLGPRLRQARAADQLFRAGLDRRLEATGVEAGPLPRPVAAAASAVAAALRARMAESDRTEEE